MRLYQSPTTFVEKTHQYFNADGKELSGITAALKRVIFPDKYKDVDPAILQMAASYGTSVHTDIQSWENDPNMPFFTEEGEVYKNIRPEGLTFIADEYLVSNETTHASKIDLVFTEDNKSVILADIKCNANLDKEYLRWQLSTYAYLFEKQNPKVRVKKRVGAPHRQRGGRFPAKGHRRRNDAANYGPKPPRRTFQRTRGRWGCPARESACRRGSQGSQRTDPRALREIRYQKMGQRCILTHLRCPDHVFKSR